MDFLDPIKKRQHTIRLNIGHFLMALLVIMGTLILVFRAYGFDVDRKSGEIIQNALLYVDSAPDGATIRVNGEQHKETTNTRLSVPDGNYKLELTKDGYRKWQREFAVIGGEVQRYTYPVLFPEKLTTSELQTFDAVPTIGTESPDRKWVLLGQPGSINTFVQYDLGNLNNRRPTATTFTLPNGLLTAAEGAQSWQFVEWSSDNKHVLLKHTFAAGQEFIMINRDDPTQSVNVNRDLGQNPTMVALRDKHFDKLYVYTQTDQTLKTADLKTKAVASLLSGVLSFKPHGDDRLVYTTLKPNDPTKARISLRSGNDTYTLRDVPVSDNLPLEIAQFDGHWYTIIGSGAEQKAYVYKDPEEVLKRRNGTTPAVTAVLRADGPVQTLSFSQNTRMIMIGSGQHFSVYDAETQRSYRYDITDPLDPDTKPVWMDGHRLLIRSGGKVVVFDYDGVNKQTLVLADPSIPAFFDRDYTALYAINSSATAGKHAFTRTELRVLPK